MVSQTLSHRPMDVDLFVVYYEGIKKYTCLDLDGVGIGLCYVVWTDDLCGCVSEECGVRSPKGYHIDQWTLTSSLFIMKQ